MNDWFDEYMKNMKEQSKRIKIPSEISQEILHLKGAATQAIEDNKTRKCYTFSNEDKFGFSETFVNYLMQISFDEGFKKACFDAKIMRENIKSELIDYIREFGETS